jgi:ligand-binding sensor domain-containing protein
MLLHKYRNEEGNSYDNSITALYADDHSGILWVGTQNGLCSFDPQTGSLRIPGQF